MFAKNAKFASLASVTSSFALISLSFMLATLIFTPNFQFYYLIWI